MSVKTQGCNASLDDAHVVKSAVRTLEILEYFDDVRQALNVVGVAAALGYPQSSTAALLRSLTAIGYLHYNRNKRTYMPTERVPFLGSWINPALFEDGALPRLMRAIGNRTGQVVMLAARNTDVAQYIYVLNEPSAVPHHLRIGQKRALAASGVGQVLLSAVSEKEVRRLYHRMNAYAHSPEEKIDVPELVTQLSAVRKRGYTFVRDRVVQGYGTIALPIPTSCTSRPLALGVGGRCGTLERREAEIVATVREEMKAYLKLAAEEAGDAAGSRRTNRISAFASMGATADGHAQRVA
jgi:DNA-binding IclR family transcriptional regulator